LRLPEAAVLSERSMAMNKFLCLMSRAISNPLRFFRPNQKLNRVLIAVIFVVLALVYELMSYAFSFKRSSFVFGVIGGCAVAGAYLISGCIDEWKNGPSS
jgi:hypothetical protein